MCPCDLDTVCQLKVIQDVYSRVKIVDCILNKMEYNVMYNGAIPAISRLFGELSIEVFLEQWACPIWHKEKQQALNYTPISVTGSGHIRYKKRRLPYKIKDQSSCQRLVFTSAACTFIILLDCMHCQNNLCHPLTIHDQDTAWSSDLMLVNMLVNWLTLDNACPWPWPRFGKKLVKCWSTNIWPTWWFLTKLYVGHIFWVYI